ncbi:hypothetical protein FRC00_006818 [Tulasnella sp. 408]|nr:hypothetical protein FRC00_006818 [Tulasnella sp. 408]
MARLREGHNLFNKIHQISDELLAEIIRCAALNLQLDSDTHLLSDPTRFKFLQNYRSVCKRWKFLIDDNSSLWAFLSADTPSPAVLRRAIAKSRNALVVISYGAGKMEREQFVKMVAPRMHRCRALWMNEQEPDGSVPVLQALLGTPCPNLEELHFWFSPEKTVQTNHTADIIRRKAATLSCFNISALQNNTQRLRTLEFGQFVRWGTGMGLTNLQELKLRESELTVGELVGSLTELPLLRSLVVDRPAEAIDQETRRGSIVEMALLTRIELLNVNASFAHAALSRIAPPSLKQLAISVRNFDLPVLPLDDIGTHCQRLILSLLEDQGTVPIPILVGKNFLAVFLSDHGTSRKFILSGVHLWAMEDRSRCAQSIVDITKWWGSVSAPSFSLKWGMATCSGDDSAAMPPEVLRPLMDIAAVVKVQIGWCVYGVQHLYQRLSYAVRGKDSEIRRWLLPRLESLEVTGKEVFHGNLVRMLRDSEIRSIVGEEHFCFELK